MKYAFFGIAIIIAFISCNSGSNNTPSTSTQSTVGTNTTATISPSGYTPPAGVDSKVSASLKGIVDNYLKLKNALTNDNGKDAAAAGSDILSFMGKVDTVAMTTAQKVTYHDLSDNIRENAEHISANAGKIAHQRKHFEALSKDIYELVKTFGGGQPLYQEFCPMAFDGKGASWVSETEEIKNPYFGDEMPTCGEVKEKLK